MPTVPSDIHTALAEAQSAWLGLTGAIARAHHDDAQCQVLFPRLLPALNNSVDRAIENFDVALHTLLTLHYGEDRKETTDAKPA